MVHKIKEYGSWVLIPKDFKKIKGRNIYINKKTGEAIDLEG